MNQCFCSRHCFSRMLVPPAGTLFQFIQIPSSLQGVLWKPLLIHNTGPGKITHSSLCDLIHFSLPTEGPVIISRWKMRTRFSHSPDINITGIKSLDVILIIISEGWNVSNYNNSSVTISVKVIQESHTNYSCIHTIIRCSLSFPTCLFPQTRELPTPNKPGWWEDMIVLSGRDATESAPLFPQETHQLPS